MFGKQIFRTIVVIFVTIIVIDYLGVLTHLLEFDYNSTYSISQQVNFMKGRAYENWNSFPYLLSPSDKCGKGFARVTILVKSAIPNVERREAIRRTWGNENRFSDVILRRFFVVGNSPNKNSMNNIQNEYKSKLDIIQADFLDSYFNNTLKTLLGFRWVLEVCPQSEYFMFVDDDYIVSVKNILRFLKSVKRNQKLENDVLNESHLFVGYVIQSAPHRHKFSKWYISLKDYPFSLWPPYVTAGAFILSKKSLEKLYSTSIHTPSFRFDDIYLGMVAYQANLTLYHCNRFYFERPSYDGPPSYKNILASHGFANSIEMEKIWNDCRSAGFA